MESLQINFSASTTKRDIWQTASALMLIVGAGCWGSACLGNDVVYVAMRSQVRATRNPVLLEDVADLLTQNRELRERLGSVDIADAPVARDAIEITRKHLELRLLLVGYEAADFQVVGAATTEIHGQDQVDQGALAVGPTTATLAAESLDVEPLEARIIKEVRSRLSDLWQLPPKRIQLSLLKPLPDSAAERSFVDDIEVTIPAHQKPGNLRPRVSLFASGQLQDVWNISVEALVFHDVVVLNKTVERGEDFSSADLSVVQRPLRSNHQYATLEQIAGKTARRRLPAGQLVQTHDLQKTRQQQTSLVKARDPVRLIARKGSLKVVVTDAIALQAGNPGDLIRVRNPRSNRIVVGRLDETGAVLVSL